MKLIVAVSSLVVPVAAINTHTPETEDAGSPKSVIGDHDPRSVVGDRSFENCDLDNILEEKGLPRLSVEERRARFQKNWCFLGSGESARTSHQSQDTVGMEYALIQGNQCGVCLEEFKEGETPFVTECGHQFHAVCAYDWIKSCSFGPERRAQACPNCNHQFPLEEVMRLISAKQESLSAHREQSLTERFLLDCKKLQELEPRASEISDTKASLKSDRTDQTALKTFGMMCLRDAAFLMLMIFVCLDLYA